MTQSSDPLPELHQAELDGPAVAELFEQLARESEILEVRVKSASRAMVGSGTITLGEARSQLEARSVLGVQITHRQGDEAWMDTLLVTEAGVRLVRMSVPTDR